MRGMKMGLVPVPRHKMVLDCDLVQGAVTVGVHPALPVDGVVMILGNYLAGGAVWANGPSAPVVTPKPVVSGEPDESGRRYPGFFPVCAVMRAQVRTVVAPDSPISGEKRESEYVVPLPDLPLSIPREEWVKSQQADPSLSNLLDSVLSEGEMRSVAHGYFLQNELLVRKWVPCEGDFIGELVFQIVVPETFCDTVLKIAHDESGHLGVRKSPGDQVLALTPLVGSPFQAKFTGPYTVERQVSEKNYFIATPKRRKSSRLCHVNLLKPYYSRAATVAVDSSSQSSNVSPALTVTSVSVGMVTPNMMVDEEVDVRAPDDPMVCSRLKNSETLHNLESLFIYLSLKELSLQR